MNECCAAGYDGFNTGTCTFSALSLLPSHASNEGCHLTQLGTGSVVVVDLVEEGGTKYSVV